MISKLLIKSGGLESPVLIRGFKLLYTKGTTRVAARGRSDDLYIIYYIATKLDLFTPRIASSQRGGLPVMSAL